ELVDKTITYLLLRDAARRRQVEQQRLQRINGMAERVLGANTARLRWLKGIVRRLYRLVARDNSFLDALVVITQDQAYARQLRNNDILVIEGDSSDDRLLQQTGIANAQALMALSQNDTETLLTTLAASSRNPDLFITSAVLNDEFVAKILRVGANNIIRPFEIAGQFLSNATFRPAVNAFFEMILFDVQRSGSHVLQLALQDDSPWIGKSIRALNLDTRFNSAIIGIRAEDGSFIYAPDAAHILGEDEVLLVVTPLYMGETIQDAVYPSGEARSVSSAWQRFPIKPQHMQGKQHYTLETAAHSITELSDHYIICTGGGLVAQNTIEKLNPDRAFVIISSDEAQTTHLLARGFRVVHGNSTREEVLHQAGITRALAIMIAVEDRAQSVLTTLTARTLSRGLLITATADSDDMIAKLRRAGADRVFSPFHVAAQFVLLATFRPVMSDFLQHVLFNYTTRLETTELYMQDDSPWIGKPLSQLLLRRIFNAGVMGIRTAAGRYIYNPPETHIIAQDEVLIVTVPMSKSDLLRDVAHGSTGKRPRSIRREDLLKTTIWMT
ncbi:MAG: NAD-binding protein, partial [Armatimonadetes bacterium]|nr:NAD-binding protein [Anaerolineae bacterium]